MIAQKIVDELNKLFPSPKCELEYETPYQLLIAVVLSAPCTDKRVCKVTGELFKEFGTPEKMLTLSQNELEEKIKSCGFYHNKAKNILALTTSLIKDFNGEVPNDIDKLQTLAGVGRKTANVVIGEAFKGDAIAVDTHVLRTSNRLGLVNTSDPNRCEQLLMQQFNQNNWSRIHLQLVHFGRYICKARNPECEKCPFKDICTKNNI